MLKHIDGHSRIYGNVSNKSGNKYEGNTETFSLNHYCSGEAESIIYFECICSLVCPACKVHLWPVWLYIQHSTRSHKRHNFQGKCIEHKMRVFTYSITLYKLSFIIRSSQRDILIYAHMSSCKLPVIPVVF